VGFLVIQFDISMEVCCATIVFKRDKGEDFLFVGRGVSDANMSDGLPCKAGMFHGARQPSLNKLPAS
jgi:hypothetical protein